MIIISNIIIFLLLSIGIILLLKILYPLLESYSQTDYKFDTAGEYIKSFGDDLTQEQIKILYNSSAYKACLFVDCRRRLFKALIADLLPKKKKSNFKGVLISSNTITKNKDYYPPEVLEEAIKKDNVL